MSTSYPLIGVNVDDVTPGTSVNGVGAKFTLGTEFIGPDQNVYRYVQASGAISTTTNEPFALGIDEDNQAAILTTALGRACHRIGWAPRQIIADNAFFWARIRGVFPIRVAASTAADVQLGMASGVTNGRLAAWAASAGSSVRVLGVVIVAAASASASAGNTIRNAMVSYPIAIPD